MDPLTLWLVSCWLASVLFVITWTIFGSLIVIQDEQIAVLRQQVNTNTRQFALFIQTVNAGAG